MSKKSEQGKIQGFAVSRKMHLKASDIFTKTNSVSLWLSTEADKECEAEDNRSWFERRNWG